jgi:hypothetical protein
LVARRLLVLPSEAHPQAGENVAHLKGRRQTVAGSVCNHNVKNIVVEGDHIVEIAANDFRGDGPCSDLEVARLRDLARQDGVLNLARILDQRHHPILAQFLVDGQPNDVEGRDQVFVVLVVGFDIERQYVAGVGNSNRRKPLACPQICFETLIEAGIIPPHDHRTHIQQPFEWRIGLPHSQPDGLARSVAKGLHQLVAAVVLGVNPPALDTEVAGKILGEKVSGTVNGFQRRRTQSDGLQSSFDAPEQGDSRLRHAWIMPRETARRKHVTSSCGIA